MIARRPALVLAMALLLAGGMALFSTRVATAAFADDLYPRWYGARALLSQGLNPYDAEVTREIQRFRYGKPLDETPESQRHSIDEHRFAYPLFIVFPLAPLTYMDYTTAAALVKALLVASVIAIVLLSFRYLRWRVPWQYTVAACFLACSAVAIVDGFNLKQPTLFIGLLYTGALLALSRRRHVVAGLLIAAAGFKPQLFVFLGPVLALWVLGDLRARWRFLASVAAALATLIGGGMLLVPRWPLDFLSGIREYSRYTGDMSWLNVVVPPAIARPFLVVVALVVLYFAWRWRREEFDSDKWSAFMALVAASTLVAFPTNAFSYNQVLLLPGFIGVAHHAQRLWAFGKAARLALFAAAVAVGWQWVSALALGLWVLIMPGGAARDYWVLPLASVPLTAPALIMLSVIMLREISSHRSGRPHLTGAQAVSETLEAPRARA